MDADAQANMYDGELAALQRLREMESLDASPTATALAKLADLAAELGVPGAGLFAKALKSGRTPAEKVLEQLEKGAYAEIARIWKHLEGHNNQLREFNERLKSQEAQSAYVASVLHALRTSDPAKHERLGILTMNCIYENDMEPEDIDGMMRAAVELTEHDLKVLNSIYKMQVHLFSPRELNRERHERINAIHSLWENHWRSEPRPSYQGINGMNLNGSFARLQSSGLIASIGTSSVLRGPTMHDYELLPAGMRFYERLQEIGTAND